jgi:hypothetical protein
MDAPEIVNNVKSDNPIVSTRSYKDIPSRLRNFLDGYAKTGRLEQSCVNANLPPKTHYRRLAADPVYQEAFAQAERKFADVVQTEVVRRAFDKESDTLLMFLARGFMPDRYRDRTSVEHSGTINLAQILEAEQRVVRMKERDAGNPAA